MRSTDQIITEITDHARVNLSDLAERIGVTGQVLTQWRNGTRIPHPDNLRILADILDKHAASVTSGACELRKLADSLEDEAKRASVLPPKARRKRGGKEPMPKKRRSPPQFVWRKGCAPVTGRLARVWRRLRQGEEGRR